MGNRSSRRRPAGSQQAVLRRRLHGSKRNSIDPGPVVHADADAAAATAADRSPPKHASCPPLGGAVPYRSGAADERPVDVRLYRSFRNAGRYGTLQPETSPEIRIYRRSGSGSGGGLRARTSVSLPRQFGRSKSAVETPLCKIASTPPPTTTQEEEERQRRGTKAATLMPNGGPYAGDVAGMGKSAEVEARRRPVSSSEYPSTDEIRRKLAAFEEHFCRSLVDRYRHLPEKVQLTSLPIAFRRRGILEAVSLYDYFTDADVPLDLLASSDVTGDVTGDVYTPIVPTALLQGIQHVRRDRLADVRLWTSLARDVVTCIALETANELARIYEYQIVVVRDDAAVGVLASHAAACVVAYVIGERASLDRNSAILGVVRASRERDGDERAVAVIVGSNQLQWRVREVFARPGLRVDANLQSDAHVVGGAQGGDAATASSPWQFYTTNFHDPATYGYRGQVLEWDYLRRTYRRSLEDEYFYTNQTADLDEANNVHFRYRPYRRLLGVDCMRAYCAAAARGDGRGPASLVEFLKQPADGASGRREIQPVYRPLTSRTENTRFDNVVLDHVDLTRLQLDSSHATGVRARHAKLLLAEFRDTKIEAVNLSGSDISYSNVSAAIVGGGSDGDGGGGEGGGGGGGGGCELRAAPPAGTARHISLNDEPVPASGADETDGSARRRVSDAEGNIVYVGQVVAKRQQQLEVQRQRHARRAHVLRGSVGSTSSAGSGNGREWTAAATPNGHLDSSDVTEQQVRRTTHGAAERRLRSQHSSQSQLDCRVSAARPTGKPPPRPAPPAAVRANSTPHIESPEVIRCSAAMPTHAAAPAGSAQARSLSSTYINGPNAAAAAAAGARGHMTKSVSLHGHMTGQLTGGGGKTAPRNASMEAYGLSLYTGRRTLSQAEVEFIRRSQVFRLIKKIYVDNLADNLPPVTASFGGRDVDLDAVCDAVRAGRLLTVTGGIGAGKSALAVAAGHMAKSRLHLTPRYVDARGCATGEAVGDRLVAGFGLRFKAHEMASFYRWLASHEQRFLLIFDNIEVGRSETGSVSRLLDGLIEGVPDVRVLCTSRTPFYGGDDVGSATYDVSDLNAAAAAALLQRLMPDMHEEGATALAEACGHVAFALVMAARSLATPSVDVGRLYEALAEKAVDGSSTSALEAQALEVMGDAEERARAVKVVGCVRRVMESLPGGTARLLFRLSVFSSWFGGEAAAYVVGPDEEEEEMVARLAELAGAGLLIPNGGGRYYVPDFVKLAARAAHDDDGDDGDDDSEERYRDYYVTRVHRLSEQYTTRRCHDALQDFRLDADDIGSALRAIIERADGGAPHACAHFADAVYALLLREELSRELYARLYESVERACAACGDVTRRVGALCCLAYGHLQGGDTSAAKRAMQTAHDVSDYLAHVDELTQAFVFHCLGRVYFADGGGGGGSGDSGATGDQGMALTKRAHDVYARLLGMRSARALLANEDYGTMATRRRWYASAHHCYNVSNLPERGPLDGHVALIASYDSRRAIWDSMLLFARATDAGRRAVAIARRHYGEHPVTATMTANLCDAVMKRGSLTEAVEVAVDALALRSKVLGEHVDTAASYKVLAYLMLRSGQYDEAVRFGEAALDIYVRLEATERTTGEVKNIVAQARYRLEYKSSVFVEIESRDASKAPGASEELHDASFRSSITTDV